MTMEWKPIDDETPVNTRLLVRHEAYEANVAKRNTRGQWLVGPSGFLYPQPTHWMPLPDPPKEPESPEEFLISLFRDIQKASTTEDIGTMTQRLLKKIDEYLKDWDARAS
jgi:hypothetical protein